MNTILLVIYISKSLERFLTYFAKCVSINEHINGSYTKTVGPNLIKFSGLFALIYTYNRYKFKKASYQRTSGRGKIFLMTTSLVKLIMALNNGGIFESRMVD